MEEIAVGLPCHTFGVDKCRWMIKGAQLKALCVEWRSTTGSKVASTRHVPDIAHWESGFMITSLATGPATSSLESTVKDIFGARAHNAFLAALLEASCL